MSLYSEHTGEVFKTMTTDNGSGFSQLTSLEDRIEILVYYAHPYTSCEKGNIEMKSSGKSWKEFMRCEL